MVEPTPGFVVKTQCATVGKVFVNMCHHELVDGIEHKAVPAAEAQKYNTSEAGIRIPLAMGERREEFDKKNEPAMVIDVIWAPTTIEQALKDGNFRQSIVELAFNYVQQKYSIELDMRFSIPKMKYKGSTVQFQRIKAKKGPKITEVVMSPQEKAEREAKGLEEAKVKEAQKEKTPLWKLYSAMRETDFERFTQTNYFEQIIDAEFEKGAGNEEDRWTALRENFSML